MVEYTSDGAAVYTDVKPAPAEVKTEGTDTKVEPPVDKKPEVKEEAHQDDEHETRARSSGWKPKDEWEGRPEDWRDAKTYNDRGELLNKIKSQGQELTRVKEAISALSDHNKKVYEAGYKSAIKDLQTQKAAAIENSDGKAVVAIDEAIDVKRAELARLQAVQPEPVKTLSAEFESFMETNPWYTTNSTMKAWSHGAAIEYAKEHQGASEKDVYAYIAKEVRKEFPEKFQRSSPPNLDGGGRGAGSRPVKSGQGTQAFEKLMESLPEEHAATARKLVKSGAITKEKYVEDYEAIGQGR